MSDLSRRLLVAADADRRRIERELHDGLQQDLVAIIVKLQLARKLVDGDPDAAVALIDEIRAEAQAALDASRELALRIYPPVLDSSGMRAALLAAAPNASVEVALGEQCPDVVAACVYFCCLELASGASSIAVRCDGESFAFEVSVTGTPDLSTLEDRVHALGGRLETEHGRVSGFLPV